MVNIKYIKKSNRTTDFYDVGKIWCFNITKKYYYKIIWNKWLFNKKIILIRLKKQ